MTRQEQDQLTPEEMRVIKKLKGKTRTEKDDILFDLERTKQNGNIIRNDTECKGSV
jgi:hypothetical protein